MLLRKSRAEEDDPDALSRHRSILCDLAAADGVQIDHVCEEVMSGEKLARRPQFQALLEVIRGLSDGCGAVLYCMDVDRISRGTLSERGLIQGLLIRKQIAIRTPGGYIHLERADELLLTEVRGALAHHELNRFRERVARTRALHVKQGRVRNGSVPFGYTWDRKTKTPTPHPLEFPILRAICADAFRMSLARLNEKYGVGRTKIHRALTSPVICGWPARTVGYVQGTGRLHYLPREEWVWPDAAGDYEAAISREEWERLQQVLQRRNKERAKTGGGEGWCRDRLRFDGHSGRVRLGSAKGGRDGSVPTYELSSRCTPRPFVARGMVHGAATDYVRRVLRDTPGLLGRIIAAEKAARETASGPDWSAEIERGKKKLEWIMEQRSEAGLEQQEALIAIERKVVAEIKRSREMMEAARRTGPDTGDVKALLEIGTEVFGDPDLFDEVWSNLGDYGRQVFVNGFCQAIIVSQERERKGYRREVRIVPAAWLADLSGSMS